MSPHARLYTMLLAGTLAGCATASPSISEFEKLAFENASVDAVRVSLVIEGRDIPLGRVMPMSRTELRVPAGALPPHARQATFRVTAVGAPYSLPANAAAAPIINSETYFVTDILAGSWRFTGSRIVAMRLGRR